MEKEVPSALLKADLRMKPPRTLGWKSQPDVRFTSSGELANLGVTLR